MKKFILPGLVIMIIIQISLPAYLIIHKYDILRTGTEYKFKVRPVDPYDAFRGRYVSLNVNQAVEGYGKYGVITVGKDGYAFVDRATDVKPIKEVYVKSQHKFRFSLPIDRYYMDEKMAPRAEALTSRSGAGEEAYVTVRIKNGELVVSGLYIDGIAIEDIILNNY